MNDDIIVNTWQDEIVSRNRTAGTGAGSGSFAAAAAAGAQPAQHTAITTVDQLKALAEPIRLAILEILMSGGPELPVMSVKELAEALGEPQTKLYRHVRQLESAGLIKVAATRLVSGIAEQRYQASQQDLDLAPGLLRQHVDETEAIMRAVFDLFQAGFLAAIRASRPDPDAAADPSNRGGHLGPNNALLSGYGRLSPARAADVRTKLREALANFDQEDSDDPDAVQMNVLVGYFGAASDRHD
jgi:DNA-binding transcriptional ArsR family regulator